MKMIVIREDLYDERLKDILTLLKAKCDELGKRGTQFDLENGTRESCMENIRTSMHFEITRMLHNLKNL